MLSRFRFLLLFLLCIFFTLQSTFAQTTPKVTVTPPTQNINPGQSATVRIQTVGVDKCTITGEPYNNFDIIKNGNILLRPGKTIDYLFNCKDKEGKVVATTTAKVTLVPVNNPTNNSTSQPTQNNNQNNTQNSQPQQQQLQQQRPQPNQYSNQSITNTANELCARYSNYTSVYPTAVSTGGVSSVPVDLAQLAAYLISIDKNSQLTANEFRQDNLLRYCTEYQNMARATARLAENAAKTVKNFAETCYADEKCMRERVYKSDIEREYLQACKSSVETYLGSENCKLIQLLQAPVAKSDDASDVEIKRKCAEMYAQGFWGRECILPSKPFEDLLTNYYAAKDRIEVNQNDIGRQFARSPVMGSRPCVETASGRPPEEIRFYEPDCIRYRQEPSILNEEALRQIAALPYTQAFSPSSVLGFDGVLDNINTRTREGNLIDPNISPNFGSNTGGTNGGTVNPGVDLKSIEGNYKKIATNIGVIVQLYDVARLAYASSTSVCKTLPVATRREAVSKIEQNKKSYLDYLTSLKSLWDNAVAKPRENHSDLIVKVNFDLKDKYNQAEIDKVYDAVKKLLQTCVDARGTS